jgi:mRNA interferase MazF
VGFERFTVVRVPFPFTDRNAMKNRPALVLSDAAAFNTPSGHFVMASVCHGLSLLLAGSQ